MARFRRGARRGRKEVGRSGTEARPGREEVCRRGREFRWIEWIRGRQSSRQSRSSRRSPGLASQDSPTLRVGIGDDAAVWRPTRSSPTRSSSLVLTVDVQVEGVHFRRDWMTLREIGLRAVTVSLSDLAAMAARPACILVSITAGEDFPDRDFRRLYAGVEAGARLYGAAIAGGNLSSGRLSITVAAVGEDLGSRLVLRSGARALDEIWVTGTPGLARIGREFLARGCPPGSRARGPHPPGSPVAGSPVAGSPVAGSPVAGSGLRRSRLSFPARNLPRALRKAVRAFRQPVARIREALAIAGSLRAASMIDLSDGLSSDLGHVLDESSRRLRRLPRHRRSPRLERLTGARGRLGAIVDEAALAGLPGLSEAARWLGASPLEACLRGGDDYELAFTARPGRITSRAAALFRARFGVPLTRIGRIVERPGLWLETPGGKLRRIRREGWEHF